VWCYFIDAEHYNIVTCFATEDAVQIVNCLFNNLPIGTTVNYYKVMGLHTLQTLHNNLFTLSSVVFMYLYRGSYPSHCELRTPNLTVLQYSHSKSSLADFPIFAHYKIF
jgi:hypothetical protein